MLSISRHHTLEKPENGPVKSRRTIASRVAELFDPLGLFEPVKLQLKIHMTELKGLDWDETLSHEDQKLWAERLALLDLASAARIPRFVGSLEGENVSHLRLICLSDASKVAGGVAIYAGFPHPSGRFSCRLLAAKSRLLDATVPRNELTAIMHMSDLVLKVQRILGTQVKEVVYATDSSIALAWCLNPKLKLRLFVYNRVEAIRRMFQ